MHPAPIPLLWQQLPAGQAVGCVPHVGAAEPPMAMPRRRLRVALCGILLFVAGVGLCSIFSIFDEPKHFLFDFRQAS